MKINMKQIMGPEWEPVKTPEQGQKTRLKLAGILVLCLMVFGVLTVYGRIAGRDSASADSLYHESEVNPSFTVQHVGTMRVPEIKKGEGKIPVLKDDNMWHASLDGGQLKTVKKQVELYREYKTDWSQTNTIAGMSFLNGQAGEVAKGYDLKEIRFTERSVTTILDVPHTGDAADLSGIALTNNQNHPKLSAVEDGRYKPNKNGKYVIAISDGMNVKLVFDTVKREETHPVTLYDYDISDGGYYIKNDYYRKGRKQKTSTQGTYGKTVYVDAVESGIHIPGNYSGDGARLTFGGTSAGTKFGGAVRDNELDTINVHNVMNTRTTGVCLGLTSGITRDGNLQWAQNIAAPDLFGPGSVKGRTIYGDSQYSMMFKQEGYTKTLSSVSSKGGVSAKELEMVGNGFWIGDVLPSYGTDGHDPVWGNETKSVKYYRSDDRGAKAFPPSEDRQNHNSFFGFNYTEDFILPAGYSGPFDIFGYSDDDLWVYAAKVNKDGSVAENSAILLTDLGGIHEGTARYTSLWDKISPVAYGQEPEHWRLFVFWLERDGMSAKCYLRFSLPNATLVDEKTESSSVEITAADMSTDGDRIRTFVFDDGTGNRYHAETGDGTFVTVTCGKEFELLSGSSLVIKGLPKEREFSMKETKASRVWSSSGGDYRESCSVSGKGNAKLSFLSTEYAGEIVIKADADTMPEGGYVFHVQFDKALDGGILAMDEKGNPHGRVELGKNKAFRAAIGAGDVLALYNIPKGTKFSVTAEHADGYPLREISVDGNLTTSERTVTGTANARVMYRYNTAKDTGDTAPRIRLRQSISGDWNTKDVFLKSGMPLSYNIRVSNPGTSEMELTVTDTVPDGFALMESTLSDKNAVLANGAIHWNVKLGPGKSKSLSFTGTVSGSGTIQNTAKAATGETEVESNTIKAVLEQ